MDEANWQDCLNKEDAVNTSPNKFKAKSLIETAKGRIAYTEENQISEENANYVFESYYTSILEMLHALIILDGFKIKNHLCISYYLRDVLKKDKLFRLFDDCRFKRNSLVYYGKRMDFEICKDAIIKSKEILSRVEILLNEKL